MTKEICRSVHFSGGYSYSVTLPAAWAKKNFDACNKVTIREVEGKIVIEPKK
jgi:virulence-associated protein VagC